MKTLSERAENSLEKALAAAMANKAPAMAGSPLAHETGNMDEVLSLDMNEVLTDAEKAFDGIYLNYPRHKLMQIAIDKVMRHGMKAAGAPMRGLRVSGPTGSGKTTGIEQYVAHIIQRGEFPAGSTPVLYIRLRKKTSVTKVLRSIVRKFGDRHSKSRDEDELNEQVRNTISRAGIKLIVLDECQHLKNLSNDSMEVTDAFKVFLDDSIVPVIFVGTNDADPMFQANPELCGRLGSPIDLKPLRWNDGDDMASFEEFLNQLDAEMVKRDLVTRASGLGSHYNVACLYLASGGVIGMAYRIVREAMLIAIARDAEYVEHYDLALATKRWAVENKVTKANPFTRQDLQQLITA
jgi:hypothetical protein